MQVDRVKEIADRIIPGPPGCVILHGNSALALYRGGFTDTDIVASAVANISGKTGRSADEARASLESFSPMQRLIRPDEVAALVNYLCSDAAAAINGAALPLDGGETA